MKHSIFWRQFLQGIAAGFLAIGSLIWAGAAHAQSPDSATNPSQPAASPAGSTAPTSAMVDAAVQQAGCMSCAGALQGPPEVAGCNGGCGSGGCAEGCYPGRDRSKCSCCSGCDSDSCLGRAFCCLYNCICCPDPCYEPHWFPLVDSAFFVESARPVNQMGLVWNSGFNLKDPDRAEYFFAENSKSGGRGPAFVTNTVNHYDLDLYMEAGTPKFGLWVLTPYEEVQFHGGADAAGTSFPDHSGFGDITIGTKSVLIDCECMMLTFGFNTYIPAGNSSKGLGTGHTTLEPALIMAFRLTPEDYLQAEMSYWIPLGGDAGFQGNIFHSAVSYNHLLCCPCPGIKIIGTLEAEEWSVLTGEYTQPNVPGAPPASAEATIVSAGPGIRCYMCDKVDLGIGSQFALTGTRWDQELIRVELRWRF